MRRASRLALAIGLLAFAPPSWAHAAAAADDTAEGANKPHNPSPTPLLDLARQQPLPTQPLLSSSEKRLADVEEELERHPPPPQADCARTLGAGRFASVYEQLGSVRAAVQDHAGAIDAYEHAIACQPRITYRYALLASQLFSSGRFADARAAAKHVSATEPDVQSVLGQMDVIEEHWADAVARFRTLAITESDPPQAQYWLCFLWFAQRRAGVQKPELPARDAYESWPTPILGALKGELSESDVVAEITQDDSDIHRREKLVEALYYIGESRLAAGETELARQYFAATVSLKVLYYIEPNLALAELMKLTAAR